MHHLSHILRVLINGHNDNSNYTTNFAMLHKNTKIMKRNESLVTREILLQEGVDHNESAKQVF